MRHQKGNKKLSRPTDQRLSLLKSLVIAIVAQNRIKTTPQRAKEAKKLLEKLITLSKRGTLHARRLVLKTIPDKNTTKTLFSVLSEKYKERNGGYSRIIRVGRKKGDGSVIAMLELVE